jgi:hypothetical protein
MINVYSSNPNIEPLSMVRKKNGSIKTGEKNWVIMNYHLNQYQHVDYHITISSMNTKST